MSSHPARKIVAIDDEPDILWAITRILKEENYLPLTKDNGAEGLELIRQEKPDLVLLDLRLPDMDGLEVLRRLREFDQESMVIILSAFDNFTAAVQAMKLGCYDFLTKPINVEEMKITLKNAFYTRNLVREVQALKHQVEQSRAAGQNLGSCPPRQEFARQSARTACWIPSDNEEIRPMKEVAHEVLGQVERDLITRALARAGGNKIKTARWLGIDYKTLFNKLKQYHIITRAKATARKTLPPEPGVGVPSLPGGEGK